MFDTSLIAFFLCHLGFFIYLFIFVFWDCSQIIFVDSIESIDSNPVVMHLDPVYQRLRVFIIRENTSKNSNDKI